MSGFRLVRWPATRVRRDFTALMRYADEGAPVIVTRNGKDAAVILSMAKYERMLAAPEIATERALATAAAIFKQAAQRKAP